MMRTVSFLVLLAAFAGADCSGLHVERIMKTSADDWTTEGGSVARTNVTAGRIRTPLRAVWQYSAQAGLKGSPLVRDSVMIVGTLNGELQAVHLTNGKRIGYRSFGAPIAGTPVLDGPRVYFAIAGKDGALLCYDLENGARLWEFKTGSVESSPILIGANLCVNAVDGIVYCVDKNTGKLVWKYEVDQENAGKQMHSSSASDGKLVAVGSDDGTLRLLDVKKGSVVWQTSTGGSIFGTPLFSNTHLVVGTLAGTVCAYEASTGAVQWTFDTHAPIYAGASAGNGLIYIGSSNGFLYALDESTGKERWSFATKSVVDSAPLVAGDCLAFGSLDHTLYVLNGANGKEIWRFTADGRIRVTPVVWGDFLLVTSEDKYITALRPES